MDHFIVTAGYVTVETRVGEGRARVDIQRGQGLPGDVPAEDRERLLARGDIAPAGAAASEPVSEVDPNEVPSGTIPGILAWVDGDPDRAGRALAAEQDKGDKARSTLVADLAAIVDQQQ